MEPILGSEGLTWPLLEQTIDVKSAAGGDHATFARLVAATKHAVTSIAARDLSRDPAGERGRGAGGLQPGVAGPALRFATRTASHRGSASSAEQEPCRTRGHDSGNERRREGVAAEEEVARVADGRGDLRRRRLVLRRSVSPRCPDDAVTSLTLLPRGSLWSHRSRIYVRDRRVRREEAARAHATRFRRTWRRASRRSPRRARSALAFVAAVTGTLAFGAPRPQRRRRRSRRSWRRRRSRWRSCRWLRRPSSALTAGIAVIIAPHCAASFAPRSTIQERRELRSFATSPARSSSRFTSRFGASTAAVDLPDASSGSRSCSGGSLGIGGGTCP